MDEMKTEFNKSLTADQRTYLGVSGIAGSGFIGFIGFSCLNLGFNRYNRSLKRYNRSLKRFTLRFNQSSFESGKKFLD